MLIVCSQCRRHIRDHESSCPFCSQRRTRNVTRLAAVAIGLAATSCSGNATFEVSDASQTTAADGSQTTSADASQTTASDGASTQPDMSSTSITPTYTIVPTYGPAPVDTGVKDASDSNDADSKDASDACTTPCACTPCTIYAATPSPR
jgi:hypothetical protein